MDFPSICYSRSKVLCAYENIVISTFFLFSISKLAAVYGPTRAALFWPQASNFSLNRIF